MYDSYFYILLVIIGHGVFFSYSYIVCACFFLMGFGLMLPPFAVYQPVEFVWKLNCVIF
jgi:hypothetical protein